MAEAASTSDQPRQQRILLLTPNRAVQTTVRGYMEGAGYRVSCAPDLPEALGAVGGGSVDLALVGAEAEEDCRRIKVDGAEHLPLVLLFGPGTDDAEARATAAGADSYLVAPLKRHMVVTAVRDSLRIRDLLRQIDELERRLEEAGSARGSAAPRPTVGGGEVYDFEFFKKLLLMEIKRSKRYAYPISLALVAFDAFQELTSDLEAADRDRIGRSLLDRITGSIRDIDLPVLFAEDKVLVFMPHTAREGALVVGERLHRRLSQVDEESGLRVTASVGLACYEGEGTVSFGSMIKAATTALRQVQVDGGDGVR